MIWQFKGQYLIFSVITCTVTVVSNAMPNSPSPTDYNTDVSYTCQTGYNHTDGDLTRTCLADGSLTGSLPVCTSKFQLQFCRTHNIVLVG